MMKLLLSNITTQRMLMFFGLFLTMSFASQAQCPADAAAIEITGTGETMASLCVDGMADPIDVTIVVDKYFVFLCRCSLCGWSRRCWGLGQFVGHDTLDVTGWQRLL